MTRPGVLLSLSLLAVLFVLILFGFEPFTRQVVSTDAWCVYCHGDREYLSTARRSFSKPHPLELAEDQRLTTCVECHMPEGFSYAFFAYAHYVSGTDLFGHFRDRDEERSGDWIPPSAARAHRVRDRLFEHDSVTCRSCHIEEEIKPKRRRGQRAHEQALEDGDTCIECHDNMVHRYVALRPDAFSDPVDEEVSQEGEE